MKHLVIAYPQLSEDGLHRIEACRKKYDPLYDIVRMHFTLVFPLENVTDTGFTDHVSAHLVSATAIPFTLNRATIHQDSMDNSYCLFLVPEAGTAELTRLYHILNVNLVAGQANIPIPFLPHITIGRTPDKKACEDMAVDWNSTSGIIRGVVDSVDIVSYESGKVISLSHIPLPNAAAG